MSDLFERLTSRRNPAVIRAAALAADRKYRDAQREFLIEGRKLFAEAVGAGVVITAVFLREDVAADYAPLLAEKFTKGAKPRIFACPDTVFSKISTEKSPEGIICTAKYLDKAHKFITIYNITGEEAPKRLAQRRFMLCSVRDPGNLGTVIRTASAFGTDELILSDCADIYHPRTVRAAMGALFRQRITVVADALSAVASLRAEGFTVLAAALKPGALPLPEVIAEAEEKGGTGKLVFAVGNEGHGLSDEFIAACSGAVVIPMAPGSESLNAAVAAAVLMYAGGKNGNRGDF